MNAFFVLLTKPFIEWKNNFRKNTLRDVSGIILSVILIVALFYAYIKIGMAVITAYMEVRVDGISDVVSREREAITMVYGVIILAGVLSATKDLSHRLFENKDTKFLLTLPISTTAIFASQMVLVYLKQLVSTTIYVMSTNVMFAVLLSKNTLFVLSALLTSVMIPLFTIAIASLIVFPYYLLKKVLGGRHVIMLVLATTVVGVIFWGYSYIIDMFSDLIASGELRFFFSAKTMATIDGIVKYLYPANIYCDFNIGSHRVINFFIMLSISLVSIFIGYLVCNRLFISVVQGKYRRFTPSPRHLNSTAFAMPTFWSLLVKEFAVVLRTPSYAFQYFSVALTMPLMVSLCMNIGVTFLDNLVGVSCNFELSIFTIIIFSMLTNTFCASNISRDGSSFWLMKSYPISPRLYIMTKVVFCFIISIISITISCIVVTAKGYVGSWEMLFVFIVSASLAFSEICFATRCDLDHPHFVGNDEASTDSDNATINTVILLGLLTAIVVGGGLLLLNVWGDLRGDIVPSWVSYLLLTLVGILGVGISLAILLVGMDKKYDRLTEGDV